MIVRNKHIIILIAIIFTSFISCTNNGRNQSENQNAPNTSPKETPKAEAPKPQISGETTEVPWANDEKFKEALVKNNTPILMSAYQTVLKDPLPGEENNVHLAAEILSGAVVNPGEVFSQNQRVGPYSESRGFQKGPTYNGSKLETTIGGGVCKIASTLYNTTVLSNLPVIERHAHGMPVPYVPYGQDATVWYGKKDFKFKNDTASPVLIWAQGIDNILYIGFYGRVKPPKVQWQHKMTNEIPPHKVYTLNTNLPSGTEKVIHEGMNGGIVKSWVIIQTNNGGTITKSFGESRYRPMPYIIEKGK